MKFKSIFILLNLTLLLFLGILIISPLLIIESAFIGTFWRNNWPFILILVLILLIFNTFYAINRQLFSLLEKEDWPALVRCLEDKVIQQGRYSPRLVRLLANTYLVLADSAAVMSLENKTAIAKPALVDANALLFGTARILGKDISGAVRFFEVRKDKVRGPDREWARWYHGFSLLLDHQFEKAAGEFSLLARVSQDAIIAGLSSHFLNGTIAKALPEKERELRELSSQGRERVLKGLSDAKNWEQETARISSEIHAAVLSKYMEETAHWLYYNE